MRTRQQIHDEWLVLQSQGGDGQALGELLNRWQERLRGRALVLLGRDADAADALQEACIAIARSIRRLEDPALFGPWARRILAHKCADIIRRRAQSRASGTTTLDAAAAAAETGRSSELPAASEELAQLRLAIDQLPIDSRALLVMRYGRDMSTSAMAATLQLREGTVKSRLHQARQELKTLLERNAQ